MSRTYTAPEIATPRVMAQTLALFYLLGGSCGLITALGATGEPARRWAIAVLGAVAVVAAAAISRWGARAPRGFFHAPVAAATLMITTAGLVAPDRASAVLCSAIMVFVGVNAFFFFATPAALGQLACAVGLATAALLLRGGFSTSTALSLDVVVVTVSLVTRRLVAEANRANRDGLTGLVNRRGLDEALQELVRPGAVLSAALLDVDHFKQINDTGGHAAGDRVLREVADTWRRALPPRAVLARHGGDEFALLLPGWTGQEALELVRRLRTLHPGTSMSCGVAEHSSGETAAQLMRRADRALYTAKDAGRGRAELATAPARRRDGGAARVG